MMFYVYTLSPSLAWGDGVRLQSETVSGESLLTYLLYLFIQFGPLGILFGVLGIRQIFHQTNPSVRKILSFYIVYTLFRILYRVTDPFAFFLTSHIFFALLMAE
jgi:hypothetical protein